MVYINKLDFVKWLKGVHPMLVAFPKIFRGYAAMSIV